MTRDERRKLERLTMAHLAIKTALQSLDRKEEAEWTIALLEVKAEIGSEIGRMEAQAVPA
jgi:hypothetical protein